MSILIVIALSMVVATMPAAGPADAERLHALGLELLEEGDHQGAVAALVAAEATGWTSAALRLHLSSAHLAAGEIGRARLHAERAARLAPTDAEVLRTLDFVRRTAGEPPGRPPTATAAVVTWTGGRVGAAWATVLALVLWVALVALVGFRAWTGRADPLIRRGTLVLLVATISVMSIAAAVSHEEARPRAVVVAPEAELRGVPSAEAPVAGSLAEGWLVVLGPRRGAWQAVRLADGATAWVDGGALERVGG
jgi:hypothetical protein